MDPNRTFSVIDLSPADTSVLAHVVVSKIVDHCPLQRLHRIYERSGVDIPLSTVSECMGEVADLWQPLVAAYIYQTDATGVKVLDPESPENIQRSTMWYYVGTERDVLFRYTPTGEGATGPWECLSFYPQILLKTQKFKTRAPCLVREYTFSIRID